MNWTVFVVDWEGLGPAKFYILMMLWMALVIWHDVRAEHSKFAI